MDILSSPEVCAALVAGAFGVFGVFLKMHVDIRLTRLENENREKIGATRAELYYLIQAIYFATQRNGFVFTEDEKELFNYSGERAKREVMKGV